MRRRPRLIEVVNVTTTAEAILAYRSAHPRADLVELRLDGIRDLDLDRLLRERGKPKLLTIRSRGQGGQARPDERRDLLRRLVKSSADWIDLEPEDLEPPLPRARGGPRRILSWHGMEGTPLDLVERTRRLLALRGADLVKVVTFAETAGDLLRIRDLLRATPRGKVIAFCMGSKGVPSRVLAHAWGSAATYAPRRGAAPSAPGQVPIEDLIEVYRWDRLAASTGLLGVLGSPIGHSLSPVMHNAALRALGLELVYLPFEATGMAEFLPLISELRIRGLSVTRPFKESVLPHLDRVSPIATRCGAVNTVVKVWNRLEGHNTDAAASVAPLRRWMRLRGSRVAVVGAGGAARAVLEGLRGRGADVTIFNRTPAHALDLARRTGARHLAWSRLRGHRCDLLINTTPVGQAPRADATPVPAAWVRARRVYDLIYNPPETLLLRRARARGAEVRGGLEMFVSQGAAQFRLFTGRRAPRDVMRRAVVEALGRGGAGEGEDDERG
ncbi:MAG TPA: shikimate dehydrogenase [Patescibacteria group bacterium]|nr:shikimate dehydrogenase [Patescibacteria group bacterium]